MKLRLMFGYAAIALSVLAVALGLFLATYEVTRDFGDSRETKEMLGEIARYIQVNGVTPELTSLITEVDAPALLLGTVVTQRDPAEGRILTYFREKIVASSDPLLVGLTLGDAQYRAASALEKFEELDAVGLSVVSQDGNTYTVTAFGRQYYGYLKIARTAFLTCCAGAWLAMASWVIVDARERRVSGLTGWSLLAVLTGPVALGVWLTARPSSKLRACCGCGAAIPRDAAYCVHCGQPAVATCPKCGRTVDVLWSYCEACGHPLKEDS